MANLFQPSIARVLDGDGNLAPYAKLYVYLYDTDDEAEYYLDQDETTPGANPQIADSTGRFTPIYLVDDIVYRIRCETSDGNTIYDVEPVRGYDEGMVQTAAEDAIQAAIDAEGFKDESEEFRNEAEEFRNETLVLRDETEELRDETLAAKDAAIAALVGQNIFVDTTIAAAITAGLAAVAEGEVFAATGDDVEYIGIYKDLSGVAVEQTRFVTEAALQAAVDLAEAWAEGTEPGGPGTKSAEEWAAEASLAIAPNFITGSRTLTEDDHNHVIMVDIPAPDDEVVYTIKVPSNSEDPLALGTKFTFVRTDGSRIRFVSDDAGDATILGPVRDLAGDQAWCDLIKESTNGWRLYGDLDTAADVVIDPGTHEVFSDFSDFDSLRQDVAGTIPVTAVGQTVCWAKNKGTKGGQFVAPSDSRGYTLEIVDGVYMLVPAAADSCFRLAAAAGINLAELDMFVGLKVFTPTNNAGVVSFQSSTNTAVNMNDGLYFNMSGTSYAFGLRAGSPAAIASATGYIGKYPHVVELHKPGNSQPFTILIDNSWNTTTNPSATVTSLGTLARDLILGAMQANNPEGVGTFGDVGFTCIVGGGDILTTDQRNQARAFVESKTYGIVPHYPALTTLAEVEAARDVLNDELYSGGGIPTEIGTISTDSSPRLPSLTNVAAFEKITMTGYTRVPRVYTPNSARTDVVVIEIEGHATPIGGNGNDALIQALMNANVPTVAIVLPDGPNDYTSGSPTQHDAAMDSLDEWTGPVSIAINTMLNRYPGAEIILTGISGGGFTSVLCAASDDRIAKSLSIVGWLPEYYHLNRDHEQGLPGVTAGFMDLAIMAAADGRRCINRLHDADTVGFGSVVQATRPDFMPTLGEMADALDGYFTVTHENVSPHAYSTADRAAVLAELP